MSLIKKLFLIPFLVGNIIYSPDLINYNKNITDETKLKLEQLINNKEIEITTFTLDAEKLQGHNVHDSMYVVINNLINSIVTDSTLTKLSNKNELDIEDAKIFGNTAYKKIYSNYKYKNMNLLSNTLKEKNIDCYLGSLIYISCADKLGLDVRYVLLPHPKDKLKSNYIHGLVRFYYNQDKYINLETTNGKTYTDQELLERYSITDKMIENKAFFKSYTNEELKSEILTATSYKNSINQDLFLRKALELNSNSYLGNQVFAAQLYAEKKYEDAINYYEKLIELYPENDKMYFQLGNCYKQINQNDKAKKQYEIALKLNPDNEFVKQKLILINEN